MALGRNMLDENQVHRLAGMAHALRPDWPLKSLVTFIDANLASRAHRDVAVALAYVACDPKSATPKRVLEAGPWWRATAAEGNTIRPPKREEACAICGREQNQHGPYAEHDFTDVDHAARDRSNTAAALARAELAQTRANLCTHGVPVAACHDHRADDSKGGYVPGPGAPVVVSDAGCFLNPAGACVRNDDRHSHAAATDDTPGGDK